MDDIMLDLETMGTAPNSAIIAIGAVAFDLRHGVLGEEFYEVIQLESAVESGGVIDPSTVLWWMKQGDAARAEFAIAGYRHNESLLSFSAWVNYVSSFEKAKIWGNGADFDNVILASAYRRGNMQLPWKFWNNRCYRTLKSLHPDVPLKRSGTYHKAIDDAISQAEHLITIMKSVATTC